MKRVLDAGSSVGSVAFLVFLTLGIVTSWRVARADPSVTSNPCANICLGCSGSSSNGACDGQCVSYPGDFFDTCF
jgi:hypothetical protein